MSRWRSLTTTAVVLSIMGATLAWSPVAAQEETRPHYLYEGRRIELMVTPEIMSVGLYPGETLEDRRALVLPSGTLDITTWPLRGRIWRVDLPPPADGELRRPSDALATLAADPAVEWVYSALREPSTSTLLLPTPRLIGRVHPGVSEEDLRASLPSEVVVVGALRGTEDRFRLELTDPKSDDPLTVSVELSGISRLFEWVEPDFMQEWQSFADPNDLLFPDQWHLRNTGQGGGTPGADSRAHQAWDIETGDGSVVIAVLDDGVQLSHPDLASRIFDNPGEVPGNGVDDDANGHVDDVQGWDFFEEDNDPNPDLTGPGSHGTSVAGVAAAAGENSIGGTGACPNCAILPVRVAAAFFGTTVFVDDSTLAEAILYAGSLADVLNNSWGGGSVSSAIDDAIDDVTTLGRGGLGSPVLFSAGNSASAWMRRKWTFFGSGAQTRILEWSFDKDAAGSAGFDTAWLDAVSLPDGTFEGFEGCSDLPSGWTSGGDASWSVVDDGRRAASIFGGQCSIKAGQVGDSERSWVRITQTFPTPASVVFSAWVSAEPDGLLRTIGCLDGLAFNVYDTEMNLLDTPLSQCGTWSNQLNPLQDGTVAYPASHPGAIAVGSASNFDRRSDYSQYGPDLDLLAHSNGGSLAVTTTDVTGTEGYEDGDYTAAFGGTSAAAPHAAGIVALLLSQRPGLTSLEVRQILLDATRKIGPAAFVNGRNDQFGHGALDASAAVSVADIFTDGFESGDTERWSSAVP